MNTPHLPPTAPPASAVSPTAHPSERSMLDRLLLTLIRRHGAVAKSELARLAGLSPQTVSVATRALESEGLLRRLDPIRGRIGQPMVPLALAPDGAYVAGAKIGRRSVEYLLADFCGGVLGHDSLSYDAPDPGVVLPWLQAQRDRTQGDLGARSARLAGLGIAMPFRLWDWPSDTPAEQRLLQEWQAIDPAAVLAQPGLAVTLVNDATAACTAEMMFGGASLPTDMAYFYIGTFIGGGIVQNGRLWTGPTGHGGALGSMLVQAPAQGPVQLIRLASLSVLEQSLQQAGITDFGLTEDAQDWTSISHHVQPWIEGAAAALAQASVTVAAVTDCRAVVIDGAIPDTICQSLVERTRDHMQLLDMSGISPPALRQGTLGRLARALGAAGTPLVAQFGLSVGSDPGRVMDQAGTGCHKTGLIKP